MDKPEEAHLQATKHILKYLKGSLNFELHLSSKGDEIYFTFADVDWGQDPDPKDQH